MLQLGPTGALGQRAWYTDKPACPNSPCFFCFKNKAKPLSLTLSSDTDAVTLFQERPGGLDALCDVLESHRPSQTSASWSTGRRGETRGRVPAPWS